METQEKQGLIEGLLGDANLNITVKLDTDQYIYLAIVITVAMLLGSLFAEMLKKLLVK